jgi:hypothetical protein
MSLPTYVIPPHLVHTLREYPTRHSVQLILDYLGTLHFSGRRYRCQAVLCYSRIYAASRPYERKIIVTPWLLSKSPKQILAVLIHEFRHQFPHQQDLSPHEREFDADAFTVNFGLDRHMFRCLRWIGEQESDTHPACTTRIRRLNRVRRDFNKHLYAQST